MPPSDFIREMVARDVQTGRHGGKVVTRFPPEPNGYLHIGHAKSIHLNFGLAQEFGGVCHLRMDDTNPTTEDIEYVGAIQRDVRWLGFEWGDRMFYASDYYPKLYAYAEKLITLGRAYVCHQTEEEMSKGRGTVAEPGTPSPWRDRPAEENLALFRRMAAGEFKEGEAVLRAKIDMASPNLKMRDPNIYRIKRAHHYRQGDRWCVYPLYDFAHCLSDAIEGITHSICTMEFENARELYDWVLRATACDEGHAWLPQQTEFARLNLTYTVMSKRKLIELVEGRHVRGWDDPRLPTLAGLRRRGVTPDAIRAFCYRIGVSKNLSTVDLALFEHVLREDLNPRAPRVMAVLKPLRVILENFPEAEVETLDAPYWPHDVPKEGSRKVPFAREVYIERDDFMENPSKGFFRLAPGREVRLRHAYIVKCVGVDKDASGEVTALRCTYDPSSRATPRKVDGTIQWVSVAHAGDVEVRLYDRLFRAESPGTDGDFKADLNPDSLTVTRAKVEPSLLAAKPGEHYQFERTGFFFVDDDARDGAPVFNRTVALKDAWARATARAEAPAEQSAKPAKDASPKPPREATAKPAELDDDARALKDAHGLTGDEARVLTTEPSLRALLLVVRRHAEDESAQVGIAEVQFELSRLAADISRTVAPGGLLVLSGILVPQRDRVKHAARRGMKSYAISAFCIHNSNGYGMLPWAFWRNFFQVRRKWRAMLPVLAPCAEITTWCIPVLRWNLIQAANLLLGRHKVGRRIPDPSRLYDELVATGQVRPSGAK